jgi:hypothetical protein
MESSYPQLLKDDKDRAVRIAEQLLEMHDDPMHALFLEYIERHFDLWLEEQMSAACENEGGFLLERLNLRPWQLAPCNYRSAIGLFSYLLETRYIDREGIEIFHFRPLCLSLMIRFSEQQMDVTLWPSMISAALEVSEHLVSLHEQSGEKLFPLAKSASKSRKNLRNNEQTEAAVRKKQKILRYYKEYEATTASHKICKRIFDDHGNELDIQLTQIRRYVNTLRAEGLISKK